MTKQTGNTPKAKCDIGFIGLGVMGANLTLNLADHGYSVACFDLDTSKTQAILQKDQAERGDQPARLVGCDSLTDLLSNICAPHIIMLSVPAGEPVDAVCAQLIEAGLPSDSIVIDTGNSLWTDSVEREARLSKDLIFFSTAVSGGEVGARFGPSLMPAGNADAWARIEPVLNAIAAKVDPNTGLPLESFEPGNPVTEGEPCVTYIGPAGAGHYVKMVHNGIEYADMQLICEAYHAMRSTLEMTPAEIADVFSEWNKGKLNSYLMEISAEVLAQTDASTDAPLVDMILDRAGQKGTGLWTAVGALELGSPAQTIASAVFARSLSALKDERLVASQQLSGPEAPQVTKAEKAVAISQLEQALYCSKICAYAQGFQLMATASNTHNWNLNFAEIAKIWRAGCIIRAVFLQSITDAFEKDSQLSNLLLDPFFNEQIAEYQSDWRQAIAKATLAGVPCPAMMSALSYYDSYRTEVLPANLLQGQRDYFGAHTYQRVDKPADEAYHTEWSTPERNEVKV